MFKIIMLIVPAFLGSLGILQTLIYVLIKRRFNEFGVVAGEITYSRFINHTDIDGNREVGALITFRYSVAGKEYESDTPLLKGYEMFPSFDYYHELTKRYPPGEIVNVHFSRRRPNVSFLEIAPLSKASTVLAPLISVGCIAIFVGYFMGAGTMIEQYFESQGGLGEYIDLFVPKGS